MRAGRLGQISPDPGRHGEDAHLVLGYGSVGNCGGPRRVSNPSLEEHFLLYL